MLNLSLSMQRDLEQDNGHSSDLDQKRSGILLVKTVHKENGKELQSWWCENSAKAKTQSSDPRVHCPEECLRAKVENCQHTIAPTRERLKLFFAQLFLWISSVFTEQSQIWVKNMNPITRKTRCGRTVKLLVRAKCDQHKRASEQWWSYTKRIAVAKIWRTNWKVITTRQIERILYGCSFWMLLKSDRTVFHDERHWRILTIHKCSGLSWVHFAKRRRFIWTKRLDQREHQKWARIRSYNLLLTR